MKCQCITAAARYRCRHAHGIDQCELESPHVKPISKHAFLEKVTGSNEEWVAQQLAAFMNKNDQTATLNRLVALDKLMYKSWAKDMTLQQLITILEFTRKLK